MCFRLVFVLFCAVCFRSCGFSRWFRLFWFGTMTEEGTEEPRLVNFASSFGCVVVVVFVFSCVSKFGYDMLRFGYCVRLRGFYNRVDPEEIGMVFNIFVHGTNLWVCFHFLCGRGSLQAWAGVDSMAMLRVFCILQLMWSCMQHQRMSVHF